MYLIQKNITHFYNQGCTFFLNPKELKEVQKEIKKEEYLVYSPYPDSEKNILYIGDVPEVLLYEIFPKKEVRHQDILGSMMSLNISKELFGDIVIHQGRYFIYLLPIVRNYFESNFLRIGNTHVTVEEVPLSTLEHYERSYEMLEVNVSSNRIDTVVSHICHVSRNKIPLMIKKKEIILNYDFLKDSSYKLKEKDVFSIKKIGKFQYLGVLRTTKSDHLILSLKKYTSH